MYYKHGESKTRLHRIWKGMKERCTNSKHKQFKDYGGRGITICPEWTNDYTVFRDWALNNGYKENLTIDRIENDGNYEPNNCQWITRTENNRSRKWNKINMQIANEIRELYKTKKYTMRDLAKKYSISTTTIYFIINNKIWI